MTTIAFNHVNSRPFESTITSYEDLMSLAHSLTGLGYNIWMMTDPSYYGVCLSAKDSSLRMKFYGTDSGVHADVFCDPVPGDYRRTPASLALDIPDLSVASVVDAITFAQSKHLDLQLAAISE